MVTVKLTSAELRAVIEWAGMAGVGFNFGPEPANEHDPNITALKKLQDAQTHS